LKITHLLPNASLGKGNIYYCHQVNYKNIKEIVFYYTTARPKLDIYTIALFKLKLKPKD